MKNFNLEDIFREVINEYNYKEYKQCLFNLIVKKIENYSETPAHTLVELRKRENKTLKGFYWETFCKWYLLNVKKYSNAWLWKEIPDTVKQFLNLTMRQDNGIDMVACKNNKYTAIQCKYKKYMSDGLATKSRSNKVTWKTLSTFVALCSRTGPWENHIVMTNCLGVGKWDIPRTPKDKTIAYNTFKNISRNDILLASDSIPINYIKDVDIKDVKDIDVKDIRELRLKYFSKV